MVGMFPGQKIAKAQHVLCVNETAPCDLSGGVSTQTQSTNFVPVDLIAQHLVIHTLEAVDGSFDRRTSDYLTQADDIPRG